jgi:two-component system copper resistance phosphate regulon response regulator CusR
MATGARAAFSFLTTSSDSFNAFVSGRKSMRLNIILPVKILVVEDESKLAAALKAGLEESHYSVRVAHSGEEGFFLANREVFDLIVLDVMLPGRDGFEILGTLRQRGFKNPVLFLTARDAVQDRVAGLDLGADDYLVKPFAFPELLARIRVLLRRGVIDGPTRFELADLEMDMVRRVVVRSGKAVALTAREFEILAYLFRHQGQVVSREMLARDIWSETSRQVPLDNVIDVNIARLRRKVDDQFADKLVHTVRGVGFVLREGVSS